MKLNSKIIIKYLKLNRKLHPNFCKPFVWDFKQRLKKIPEINTTQIIEIEKSQNKNQKKQLSALSQNQVIDSTIHIINEEKAKSFIERMKQVHIKVNKEYPSDYDINLNIKKNLIKFSEKKEVERYWVEVINFKKDDFLKSLKLLYKIDIEGLDEFLNQFSLTFSDTIEFIRDSREINMNSRRYMDSESIPDKFINKINIQRLYHHHDNRRHLLIFRQVTPKWHPLFR